MITTRLIYYYVTANLGYFFGWKNIGLKKKWLEKNILLKKNLVGKKYWFKKNVWYKNFGGKHFFQKNIFGQQIFLGRGRNWAVVNKKFCQKNIWVEKILGKKKLGWKNIWLKQICGWKKMLVRKFLVRKFLFRKFVSRKKKLGRVTPFFLHISSSWVKIRLHTKNQLPRLP